MDELGPGAVLRGLGTIHILVLGADVRDCLAEIPNLPPARAMRIAEGVRGSGVSVIIPLRAEGGNDQVVTAASEELASFTKKAAFAAADLVLVGLICTLGLPNPMGGADVRDDDDSAFVAAAG